MGLGEIVFYPLVAIDVFLNSDLQYEGLYRYFFLSSAIDHFMGHIVHSNCFSQLSFLFLFSQDVSPLHDNGIMLLGVSLWWLGKVSPRNHLLIGWLCVWCMVRLGWVIPRTLPCYWHVPLAVYETQQCVRLTVNTWFSYVWACFSLVPCGIMPNSRAVVMLRDWWAH